MTTTVKMLSTLLLPTSGTASIFGLDILKDTSQIRTRIGFTLGGNKGLYSRLSGLDNLKYFAELYKLDPDIISKRIKDLLEVVGLTGREKDRVETYSSGMQQRLHLALTALCILLLSITSCGMGLVFGSLSLRSRDAWTITSMFFILLYMLSGVNFPVSVLPKAFQYISYSLPLTRGIQAARLAMSGADWSALQSLFMGELLVGLIYIVIGYLMFTWFEKLSLVDGQIETM